MLLIKRQTFLSQQQFVGPRRHNYSDSSRLFSDHNLNLVLIYNHLNVYEHFYQKFHNKLTFSHHVMNVNFNPVSSYTPILGLQSISLPALEEKKNIFFNTKHINHDVFVHLLLVPRPNQRVSEHEKSLKGNRKKMLPTGIKPQSSGRKCSFYQQLEEFL